ncbi:efflux RND transporter permease subunit [Flavobacteriaceae bacterium]|nr:efflux RND transporter permease subunit [Flavobacteriaceae bacterium]
MGFWNKSASIILRNRYAVLVLIAAITVYLGTFATNMRLSYTEANMLPEDSPANVNYNHFLEIFGEEGNLVLLGVKDTTLFTPEKFKAWNELSETLNAFPEVQATISISDLKVLVKNQDKQAFELEPLIPQNENFSQEEIDHLKDELFNKLPFYDNLLYSSSGHTIQTAIYIKKDIVNSKLRKAFIFDKLNPLIADFERAENLDVHISGMPYIRSMNSQNIVDEIGVFVGLALLVTSFIFFLFFKSWRATFITLLVVSIGVIWSCGFIGLFDYEITVLTGLIPPLIIVIGVPNAIFLINKYQQEIKKHGNQARSLQRVITKIGNATLMTNLTTASGFATFIFTNSQLLVEFGIIASISIMAIFFLALLIIPVMYSFMPLPKAKHLDHLERRWMNSVVVWMEKMVKEKRIEIYITSVIIIILGIIGVYQIKVSGSLIDDMPKEAEFFHDIEFFQEEFGGIMPLEILIDTKKDKGVLKLSTLKRIERMNEEIAMIPGLSKPMSINNVVKYAKQAFYNGNPKYYQLPTNQERTFILSYLQNMEGNNSDLLENFVDKSGRYARVTTYMKDVGTDQMQEIQERINEIVAKQFPENRYDTSVTGKALVFLEGTHYLIKNLVISLSLAIVLIALFMGYMFRSFQMIIVSIIPNLLPLLTTAGLMGYLGIPIKPSTILVFSIAFGISVDDTIHFLAKYRQELMANNWKIRKSVYAALRETGVSMFYTSIVLFFGFLVFTVSDFGGTKALGGLVSITLLFAMTSNLLLLPSLLLSFEKKLSNKKVFKKLSIDILPSEED